MQQFKSYPAKLLLFGEQTVLRGSNALAIPFPTFQGTWKYKSESDHTDHPSLQGFADYLHKQLSSNTLNFQLNISQFQQDIDAGLFFQSDIPIGYGAGSSGALCAAIYDQYVLDKLSPTKENLPLLKSQMAMLENYFHGKSSGTDPLIIYVNKPLLIEPDVGISNPILNRQHAQQSSDFSYFLIDTGIKRKTETYVNHFLQLYQNPPFQQLIDQQKTPAVNQAISSFINGHDHEVFEAMKTISTIQQSHFDFFIPPFFKALWQEGLSSGHFYLKICGAGGGGFLLGITSDQSKLDDIITNFIHFYLPI